MNLKDFQKLNFLLQCENFTSVDQSENHEMADDLPDNKDMNLQRIINLCKKYPLSQTSI